MLTIELRLFANNRPLSLEDFADLVARRVADRVKEKPKEPVVTPRPERLQPLLVSVKDATQLIGLSRSTLWDLIKEKRLDIVRLGGRTLITMESLQRMLSVPMRGKQPGRQSRQPKPLAVVLSEQVGTSRAR